MSKSDITLMVDIRHSKNKWSWEILFDECTYEYIGGKTKSKKDAIDKADKWITDTFTEDEISNGLILYDFD